MLLSLSFLLSEITMHNCIKYFRKRENMTQERLAEICAVRRETISNLEAGKYNPSWDLVYRIARALQVCPCVLMAPSYMMVCQQPDYLLIE